MAGVNTDVHLNTFLVAKTEVTVADFREFIEQTNYQTTAEILGWSVTPSWKTTSGASWRNPGFQPRDSMPVVGISWYDAVEYCNWRSETDGLRPAYSVNKQVQDPNNLNAHDKLKWTVRLISGANGYRLPSEAEWTVAAQGGRRAGYSVYAGSNDPNAVAWQGGNSSASLHPFGTLKPNELGIYDMSGNVWEWCYDWWGSAPPGGTQPMGPISGEYHFIKGGGAWDSVDLSQITHRGHFGASYLSAYSFGMRLFRNL